MFVSGRSGGSNQIRIAKYSRYVMLCVFFFFGTLINDIGKMMNFFMGS